MKPTKIIVAISGASGFKLGLKTYKLINKKYKKYLIVSNHAKIVYKKEDKKVFKNSNISAPFSSGSFGADVMLIVPCSMNTVAKIANGIADNLITRTASVMIKEGKKLLIAPREMPYNAIMLENMLKLKQNGVIVAPPNIAYYSGINSIDDLENFIIGKWFDAVGIKNKLYKRWK
jgi:4-hydroxy-3-polyprenylbenzoate decarboxylase